MKLFLFSLFMLLAGVCCAQAKPVVVIDFVKIINNQTNETLFFYENNWKVYREIALKKGYIKSYQIIKTTADSLAAFDLMLVTEYNNLEQQQAAEERFQQIIKEIRPDGPRLLNTIKPAEFRKNLFAKRGELIVSSYQ